MNFGFSFRIAGIPVRVHAAALLTALIFGASVSGPIAFAGWIFVYFTAVLAHELGHALVGRMFGLSPSIHLHGLGGTTVWSNPEGLSPSRSVAVSLSGPLVGIGIGSVIAWLVIRRGLMPHSAVGKEIVYLALWANLVWSLLNLVPILPLDGGHVMAALFAMATKGKGQRAARILSIAFAVIAIVVALVNRFVFAAVLAGLFIYQNFRSLRELRALDAEGELHEVLQKGEQDLEAGLGHSAIMISEDVFSRARTLATRARALKLLAKARLLEGHWETFIQLLELAHSEFSLADLQAFKQATLELDRPEEARRIDLLVAQKLATQPR